MFSQSHLTELYTNHKSKHLNDLKDKEIYSGDTARARIVRAVEETKCAFTKDVTQEEKGQCTFGGCRVIE